MGRQCTGTHQSNVASHKLLVCNLLAVAQEVISSLTCVTSQLVCNQQHEPLMPLDFLSEYTHPGQNAGATYDSCLARRRGVFLVVIIFALAVMICSRERLFMIPQV